MLIKSVLLLVFFTTQTEWHAAEQSTVQKVQQSLNLVDAKDDVYNSVIAISPSAQQAAELVGLRGATLLKGMPIGPSFTGKRVDDHTLAQPIYHFTQLWFRLDRSYS